ncbi:periplasmic Cu(I)/Cu(II)-binding protein CopK [Aromatoleum evansii]|uniref:periplasmic Cu(I)/Cu(II)-binding protein CopK n=1 Tax=Aromatoleum evansii TaxID=59406 RepID=UPI00145D1CE2|nr:periplasmic Cu(I)/Cu(II)-binding protein CopK [Aromatoleum evansii]NMG29962.1 periplasmic Cu(I)/Cu(II)-binding protein CopK [Aromatoleum evansii]
MLMKLIASAASVLIATSAFAVDQGNVEKSYELKDGSTVYIFKDGKMAMENKVGQAVSMKEGHTMETKDGKKIMMKGNEIWRLDSALHREHQTN